MFKTHLTLTVAIAGSVYIGVCAMAAWSESNPNSENSVSEGSQVDPSVSATKNGISEAGGTTGDAHTPLVGGIEQREIITLPGVAQTTKRNALPKLTLEIPKFDKMPSVPKFLQAGATFNDSEETPPTEGGIWYMIPNFMAGNWQCTEKTITSSENLQTGRGNFNTRTEEFISELHQGHQQDRTGAYWQFQNTPFLGHSIGPNNTVHYSYVQLIEPISCSKDRFVRRCILTKAQVDGSQTVQNSQQVELIQAYTPLDDSSIREDTVARQIEPNGKANWQNTSIVVFHKTRPYSPQNRYKEQDMKQMFCDYLNSHGMQDLVPQK